MSNAIVTITNKKDEKILRRKTEEFDFEKFSRKEIGELLRTMRKAMHAARGIGLSANQLGLPFRVFVAEVPGREGGKKFYAVFNPKIEKAVGEKVPFEEGCLSVPLTYGTVERSERITLAGFDKNGRSLKIKAWGLLARVFQHEADHLDGKLFIDKAKSVHRVEVRSKE